MNKDKVKPVADKILVIPNKVETKTESGIYIPDSSKQKQLTGTAHRVGDEVMVVKYGDVVMYPEHAGTDIGDGLLIMKENIILCILEK